MKANSWFKLAGVSVLGIVISFGVIWGTQQFNRQLNQYKYYGGYNMNMNGMQMNGYGNMGYMNQNQMNNMMKKNNMNMQSGMMMNGMMNMQGSSNMQGGMMMDDMMNGMMDGM